ncbi:glutaredoxin-C6-like [Phragmites australis]|uniref:glutaredoxin-C6-like n=1 Tax=Phragmites australis TaxID=29695 RepID=UPI002D77DF8E|nr:glutaredoxin-C6-like [Phragmites australis]
MGITSSSSNSNPEPRAMALAKAKEIVASAPVVVFSKSYCPFCVRVKQLFQQLGATFKAIELDVEGDGSEIQAALKDWTGQNTVPNVFINGKHIGGCDDTMALNNGGKLVPLLTEAGAISGSASKTTTTA